MHRHLHTGGILSINLTHKIRYLYDTVRELRLGRLADSRAERDNLLIGSHQFSEALYVVVLLNLLKVVVEEEHLTVRLRKTALQLQFPETSNAKTVQTRINSSIVNQFFLIFFNLENMSYVF